jgi:hypothetical protein
MGNESDLNRRKFMEIGIYTITGTIAAVSGVALARFAVGSSFEKKQSKWIELNPEDVQEAAEGFARVVLEYEQKDGWLTATSSGMHCYLGRRAKNISMSLPRRQIRHGGKGHQRTASRSVKKA